MSSNTANRSTWGLSQVVALVLGLVFLAIGAAGFAVTGTGDWFATDTGATLMGFEINPFHNVVHLLIGLALAAGATSVRNARGVLVIVGVAYLAVGVAGFWMIGTEANILSLNMADNWLHIGTAAVALLTVAVSASASTRRGSSGGRVTA